MASHVLRRIGSRLAASSSSSASPITRTNQKDKSEEKEKREEIKEIERKETNSHRNENDFLSNERETNLTNTNSEYSYDFDGFDVYNCNYPYQYTCKNSNTEKKDSSNTTTSRSSTVNEADIFSLSVQGLAALSSTVSLPTLTRGEAEILRPQILSTVGQEHSQECAAFINTVIDVSKDSNIQRALMSNEHFTSLIYGLNRNQTEIESTTIDEMQPELHLIHTNHPSTTSDDIGSSSTTHQDNSSTIVHDSNYSSESTQDTCSECGHPRLRVQSVDVHTRKEETCDANEKYDTMFGSVGSVPRQSKSISPSGVATIMFPIVLSALMGFMFLKYSSIFHAFQSSNVNIVVYGWNLIKKSFSAFMQLKHTV